MHEASLAASIIETVCREAGEHGGGRVPKIRLRLGEASHVVTESLRFAFDVLSKETNAEGAELEFERVPLRVRCRRCGAESGIAEDRWVCGSCGEAALDIINGMEMEIDSFDMED